MTEGLVRDRNLTTAGIANLRDVHEISLRRRLEALAADAEAERAVLDARLRELAKRLDETFART